MENWFFIVVLVVLITTIILNVKFLKIQEDYKVRAMEMQQKIDTLKEKSLLRENNKNMEYFDSKKMSQITQEVLYLHNLIVKRHLR